MAHHGLGTVQHDSAIGIIPMNCRGHRTVIRTSARLGKRQRKALLAGLLIRLHALSNLLRRAESCKVIHGKTVRHERHRGACAAHKLFHHQGKCLSIGRNSAVLFGNEHVAETSLKIGLAHFVVHATILVPLFDALLGNPAIAELAKILEHELLFVSQFEIHSSLLTFLLSLFSIFRMPPALRQNPLAPSVSAFSFESAPAHHARVARLATFVSTLPCAEARTCSVSH